IHSGGQRLCEYANDDRRRIHPTIKPGMTIPEWIPRDLLLELVENGVGTETLLWGIGIQIRGREIARERAKDRLFAKAGQMVNDDLDGTVSHAPQLVCGPFPLGELVQ